MAAAVNTGVGGSTKYLLSASVGQGDDDFVDRCSHTFTTLLLLVFTLLISCRQYMGKPISCWVPTEFTRAQEEYAENVCWVTSTYFLPSNVHQVPISTMDRDKTSLGYYQWVPFLLMLQALLFNVPCIIWKLFNWQSGIQLSNIMQVATESSVAREMSEKRHHVNYLAHYIQDNLHSSTVRPGGAGGGVGGGVAHLGSGVATSLRKLCQRFKLLCATKLCCILMHRRYGNYLISLYLIVKFLYLCNACGQVWILHRFVQTNYSLYGWSIMYDLYQGRNWDESGHFPRVTLCDFEIRKLANTHRYTVQCVLPINMFNEKIFIFLWFWYILLVILTVYSFFKWSYRFCRHTTRRHFVRHFLVLKNLISPQEKSSVKVFTDKFIRPDGAFILYLIDANVGELMAADVVEKLWFAFKHCPSAVNRDVTGSVGMMESGAPAELSAFLPMIEKDDSGSSTAAATVRLRASMTGRGGSGGGGGSGMMVASEVGPLPSSSNLLLTHSPGQLAQQELFGGISRSTTPTTTAGHAATGGSSVAAILHRRNSNSATAAASPKNPLMANQRAIFQSSCGGVGHLDEDVGEMV